MYKIEIEVLGLASKKIYGPFMATDPEQTLMSFLIGMSLPIASSCSGEGVCRKCVIQDEELSCQLSIANFVKKYPSKKVLISYL